METSKDEQERAEFETLEDLLKGAHGNFKTLSTSRETTTFRVLVSITAFIELSQCMA